jgi:uncharacterized protein YbjT (DUF2867 family)
MILVAGGTGVLGTKLVGRLSARGLPVRVLARHPADASYPVSTRVEMVQGDVRDPASLLRSMAGVDTVVSAVQGFDGLGGNSPASVDSRGNANLIDAAAASGAGVVLMSVVGASAGSPMELFRMKYAAEQYLRSSAVRWTIVRATAFLETWIGLLEQTASKSGRPLVFGRGDNPINFVSATDVATLVDRTVTDPSLRGKTLEVGGPENLTLNQLAATIQKAAGRAMPPRHVPRAALRIMALALKPINPTMARMARAALVMDSANLSFDATAIHAAYPGVPATRLLALLANRPGVAARH